MKQNAMERSVSFSNRKLFWTEMPYTNEKNPQFLCNRCGSPKHRHDACPQNRKNSTRIVSDKWKKIYNKFAPAGHTNRTCSRSCSNTRNNNGNPTSDTNALRRPRVSYASTTKGLTLDDSIHNPKNIMQQRPFTDQNVPNRTPAPPPVEIGRASCRERV